VTLLTVEPFKVDVWYTVTREPEFSVIVTGFGEEVEVAKTVLVALTVEVLPATVVVK
jgi:hypothetical protein